MIAPCQRSVGAAALAVVVAATVAVAQPAATPLLTPVTPACVSSPFGPRKLAGRPLAGTFHAGIDIPAAAGAPVRAIAAGRIIRIQRHGVGGLEMMIQHDGFIGIYSHLGLIAPVVAEGNLTVSRGERVATVGRSGLTYGTHLYFGMVRDGHAVDPAPYLAVASCGGSPGPSSNRRP